MVSPKTPSRNTSIRDRSTDRSPSIHVPNDIDGRSPPPRGGNFNGGRRMEAGIGGVIPASSSPPRRDSPYRDPFRSSSVDRRPEMAPMRAPSLASNSRAGSPSPPLLLPSQSSSMQGTDPVWYGRDTKIWGTDIDLTEFTQVVLDFISSFKLPGEDGEPYYPRLMRALRDHRPFSSTAASLTRNAAAAATTIDLNIDADHIASFNDQMYRKLIQFPSETMLLFDVSLNQYYRDNVLATMVSSALEAAQGEPTIHFVTRLFNLREEQTMRQLQPEQIDTLIKIKGMVTRVSKIIPDMALAYFRCMDCFDSVTVRPHKGRITEPHRCTNCRQMGTYMLQHNLSEFENKQIIKVQEAPEAVPEGETPGSVTVSVFGNLVDFVLPGDRIVITGIYRCSGVRTKSTQRSLKSIFKTYIDGYHISKIQTNKIGVVGKEGETDKEYQSHFDEGQRVPISGEEGEQSGVSFNEEDIEDFQSLARHDDIYELLTRSLAPSIFAMADVKRGLLCQLFGGTNKKWERSRVRGEINVLLCGDPGVAKSQLLTFVHRIAPRGIYTSGRGSSSVGLTAYVVRDADSGDLVLESGALVLSDKGICCIDEFDKMSDSTKSVLHEVMEQQTVSIAKAGIIATLNARTSLLAAANPVESKWNKTLSVVENLKLEPTLISRFDLIYVLIDRVDELLDRHLALHILKLFHPPSPSPSPSPLQQQRLPTPSSTPSYVQSLVAHKKTPKRTQRPSSSSNSSGQCESADDIGRTRPLTKSIDGEERITLEMLTKYITYARQTQKPLISDAAHSLMVDRYVELRQTRGTGEHTISATTRQLESLIRLSEALAKMRLKHFVEPLEVEEAYRLMCDSLKQYAVNPKTGQLDVDVVYGGVDSSINNTETLLIRMQRFISERHLAATVAIDKFRLDFVQYLQMNKDVPRWQFLDILRMAVDRGIIRRINGENGTIAFPSSD